MNAQIAELEKQDAAYEQPGIRELVAKLKRAQKELPGFHAAQKRAEEKCVEAEVKRTANTDPVQGPAMRQALVGAQQDLVDADESLEVLERSIGNLRAQIDSSVALFHDREFKRVMEAYKLAKADSRKRRQEAERADVDIDRKFLAELALHKEGYPAFVDHGNPQIHIGDGSDILSRRMIADCEIGESKTFFRLLKVQQ